jgi:hypothetical protein
MVTLDHMIRGLHIEGSSLKSSGVPMNRESFLKGESVQTSSLQCGSNFIKDLGNLIADLHTTNLNIKGRQRHSIMWTVAESLIPLAEDDEYIEDALFDLYEYKSQLTGKVLVHGDLWRQNIFVDDQGQLTGLIDWESLSKGDPHWEFRMIHRYIGWNGLEKLLDTYHSHEKVTWTINIDIVEILNRIAVANSIKIRKERGLLRHDAPDALEKFEAMKNEEIGCVSMLAQVRPSTDVPFESASLSFKSYIKHRYKDTGKLLSQTPILSADGLIKHTKSIFKDKKSNIEFLKDPKIVAQTEEAFQYNKEQGINTFIE